MSETIRCPKCAHDFELTAVVRSQIEAEVRSEVANAHSREIASATQSVRAEEAERARAAESALAEARTKLEESSRKEAELLRKHRELDDRARELDADVERRITAETQRVREDLERRANERIAAKVSEALLGKDEELAEARTKLEDSSKKEAGLLRKQRELDDRARELDADVERRITAETQRVREDLERRANERIAAKVSEALLHKNEELAEARTKLEESSKKEGELLRKQRELDDRARELDADVERRIAAESQRVREDLERRANDRIAAKVSEALLGKDEELAEIRTKLEETSRKEVELLRRQRDLDAKAAQLDLTLEKELLARTEQIRDEIQQRANSQAETAKGKQALRDQEHREQIDALKSTISSLQQRIEQRSQQLQGEAQEVVLKDVLSGAFPMDTVEDVAKGERGADLVQRVFTADRRDAGAILWESKRTRTWSDSWLSKLRDDQRENGCACAVIVSQTLPPGRQHFELRDGVWVCGWEHAVPLALVLRIGMIELSDARRVADGRGEKMATLYSYLTGPEFRLRVQGIIEAFTEMQEDLAKEKRMLLTQLRKRERQIERALTNLAAFCGDVRGIAGGQIQEFPAFEMKSLELPPPSGFDRDDSQEFPSASPEQDGQLLPILLALVPADGAPIGNGKLLHSFSDRVLYDLQLDVTGEDYERCKQALIDQGQLRRGRGRGGSVLRATPISEPGGSNSVV
jgi:hypothetical protein